MSNQPPSDLPPKSPRSREPRHIPVLPREVLTWLSLEAGLTVVDGTVGAGGHSRLIAERVGPEGRLIGLDRDPRMLEIAARALPHPWCQLVHASYANLREVLDQSQLGSVDRVLLDLGLSSVQLEDDERGFSVQSEGPLDLRFDPSQGEPAWRMLQRLSIDDLARILWEYAEEPHSRRLAATLGAAARNSPRLTARELADAVADSGLARHAAEGHRHPATRVFQALRIAVNHELEHLERFLKSTLPDCLRLGGVAVMISFQSLEDRLVKHAFRDTNLWQVLTPKPVLASIAEQRANPRSRTAKLRAARRT